MKITINLITIVFVLTFTSCKENSQNISKAFDNSTITATLVNDKFNGTVEQTFLAKDRVIQKVLTNWDKGKIDQIILIDDKEIRHEMQYIEKEKDNKVTAFYKDVNDSTYTRIPVFDKEFLDFCESYAFLSEESPNNLDSMIMIYNIPENSYQMTSSPFPVKRNGNALKIIDNGYKSDSLIIQLIYLPRDKMKTNFTINIKNAR